MVIKLPWSSINLFPQDSRNSVLHLRLAKRLIQCLSSSQENPFWYGNFKVSPVGFSAHVGVCWCDWEPGDPMGAYRSQHISVSFLLGIWSTDLGQEQKDWLQQRALYPLFWVSPAWERCHSDHTDFSGEPTESRAYRDRKHSDSLPLETWQAARQNFEAGPANKLHASLRQLTPWLLNPIHILCYLLAIVLHVWSAYPPDYFIIPSPSQVLIVLDPKGQLQLQPLVR